MGPQDTRLGKINKKMQYHSQNENNTNTKNHTMPSDPQREMITSKEILSRNHTINGERKH